MAGFGSTSQRSSRQRIIRLVELTTNFRVRLRLAALMCPRNSRALYWPDPADIAPGLNTERLRIWPMIGVEVHPRWKGNNL